MAGHDGIRVNDRRTFMSEDDLNEAYEGDAPEPDTKPTYVQELEERTRHAEEQLQRYIRAYKDEVEGQLQRRLERLEREKQRELDRDREEVVLELLEVLDNFDRSLQAIPRGADHEAMRQGLQLVRDQFFSALQKLGVEPVAAAEQTFDPKLHEATAVVPVAQPELDGKVVEVEKAGYRIGDRVVRPSLVHVGRLQ